MSDVIEYRNFRNDDPPSLIRLWHEAELGRAAASHFDADAFEECVLCQPYFDREGVIIAEKDGEPIGYAHAGFGLQEDGSSLDHSRGIICVVMVSPSFRRQGVGTALVRKAEEYLRSKGATTIQAGAAPPHEPFYIGLYGGSRPAGFMESDPAAAPFIQALGYESAERHQVFQRNIAQLKDPVSMRLVANRRSTKVVFAEDPVVHNWGWMTRFGRYEPILGILAHKKNDTPLACVTLMDMHFYAAKWQHRGLALLRLEVGEEHRRNGYAQSLLIEVCRKLRQELVTVVEIHVPEASSDVVEVVKSSGFENVDTGVVYTKALSSEEASS